MSAGSIACRWARALFDIVEQEGSREATLAQLAQIAGAWQESEELREVMENPMVPAKVRSAIFMEIVHRAGASRTLRNFFGLLLRKGRLPELPAIYRELLARSDRQAGRVRAEVISAAPLPTLAADRLKAALETVTDARVLLTQKEDPALVAGVVTRVGGLMIDGSLRTQLERLREGMRSGG
jgi:F-type H+-transporting ATPase subunit delta